MKSFGNAVVKARHLILILAFVLLVPAVWGYTHTRVNYDILTYLPDSIETIKGRLHTYEGQLRYFDLSAGQH